MNANTRITHIILCLALIAGNLLPPAQLSSANTPSLFNADNGTPALFDTRSDNKGLEPECVAAFVINGNASAFIDIERAGGRVMVYHYNVSNPQSLSFFQSYTFELFDSLRNI